ncbi:uncharacterized protein LOC136087129 [Hydra vulgaris]|uniref:Uncharacterized protein LOC136087129 n=1 Tax=Hydra vulgaris TaxID=6087 RepID=A0ABM4CUV4_HYDVU
MSSYVTVNLGGTKHNLHVCIASVSADNLGAHSLAGFRCCFNSGRICRFCLVDHKAISLRYTEDYCSLRTISNYNTHLQAVKNYSANKAIFGIIKSCSLDRLPYFNVIESFPPDLHHDILEGIVPLLLKMTIQKLIENKIINLIQLNYEIKTFPFGFRHSGNVPCEIRNHSISANGHLSVKASENWCLFRNFPIIIIDYLSIRCENLPSFWEVFLLFRQISDILFSFTIKHNQITYLICLIGNFLYIFSIEYPDKMTPKMHYLIHYPKMLCLFGLLRHLWCMRFESKHNYFIKLCHIISNFKNITFTLSKRHQMRQCAELNSYDCLRNNEAEKNGVTISTLCLPKNIQDELFDCLKLQVYLLIIWYFVGNICTCSQFLHYCHSYCLSASSTLCIQPVGSEASPEPLDGYITSAGCLVTLRKEDIDGTVLLDMGDFTLKELIPIIKLRVTFKKAILKRICTEASCSDSPISIQSLQSVIDFSLPILNSTSS